MKGRCYLPLIRIGRTHPRATALAVVLSLALATAPVVALTINLTYDPDSTFLDAGLSSTDIANMKVAASYAALQLSSDLSDGVNVNIRVTAVAGTGTLGQSTTLLMSVSDYAALRTAIAANAKTADDATALGSGGSLPTSDPIVATHSFMVSKAEAKALGLALDDLSNDGTFTFGGGLSYTYDPTNRAVPGTFDFIGIAMHEFSEIMGRIPLMGQNLSGSPDYMLMDLYHYTGPGARGLNQGPGRFFSIDNGTTLLKAFNDADANGGDPSDWDSGTNDAFNAFFSSGVTNDLSPVDLSVMDAIGYDATGGSPTPTPTPTLTPTPTPTATPTPTPNPTPPPTPTAAPILNPTSVSGNGTINTPSGQASFSITATKGKKKCKGSFSYNDPTAGVSLTSKKLGSFSITGSQIHFTGSAKIAKKKKVAFTVDATDNGEPGTLDAFSITVTTGYSAGGNLTTGDIVIH